MENWETEGRRRSSISETCRHGLASLDCQACLSPEARFRLQEQNVAAWQARRAVGREIPVDDVFPRFFTRGSAHARAAGAKGGRSTSPAKLAACRANMARARAAVTTVSPKRHRFTSEEAKAARARQLRRSTG